MVASKLSRFYLTFLLLAAAVLLPFELVSAQSMQGKAPLVKPSEEGGKKPLYPPARKSEQVDDYHGVKVTDSYRWLEDPDSAESRAWIEAQNRLTFGYLDQVPERVKIKDRITKLWNYERFGMPYKQGGRYFFSKNDGLQNQNVLYVMESLEGTPRVLLDPNKLSSDGTVALTGTRVSEDGKLLAYGTAGAGSDWQEWRVRDIETGKDTSDVIKWVKFSGASWTKDGKGFFYSRYPQSDEKTKLQNVNLNQKLYYHTIGTPQSEDKLIYEIPDHPDWFVGGGTTDDGKYLIIGISNGSSTDNLVYYKDLSKADSSIVKLIDKYEAQYNVIDNDGPVLFVETTKDAPRGRVIAIDTRKPEPSNWKEIIPQAQESLSSVSIVGNVLAAQYLKDAYSKVKIFDLSGKFLRDVELPGIGSAGGFGGKRGDKETFYSFTSFTTPATVYRYDISTGKSSVFRQPKVEFDPNAYEVKQVFYNSKDGTKVPMFIVHKKGLKLDGQNPTLLYGYGGFNIALTPTFSVARLTWMEMGGVFAMPNLRGGGEYGEDWHKAGTKLKKQNVFDDFIAAAEWLIKNNYTSPAKLAISGGSNGGLLVGAVLNQRPELFGAALPAVGVMDMLRFHKFTIGYAWVSDYGSSEKAEEFKALYAYSPLHNIKTGAKYPAVMITTADHDDRVVPAHSFKYAAALQSAQGGDAPVLIRIETKAGHGGGKPTTKIIEEVADTYGFLIKALNVKVN